MSMTMDGNLRQHSPQTQRSHSHYSVHRGAQTRMRDLIVSNFLKKYLAVTDPEGDVNSPFYSRL
jgi:hypothetical protein